MMSSMKAGLLLTAGLIWTTMPCPLCSGGTGIATAATPAAYLQASDTALVRLHISGMTCGSCPATARLALKKLAGVYSVTVTLDDSLGVVRYDPRRVTPGRIAAHLTRLTGYGATVLPDSTSARDKPGGA
jgi:copper chaperone CopZ